MKQFFKQNQRELLAFANTIEGKYLLGVEKDKDKIVKIFPNGFSFLRGYYKNRPILQGRFYIKNQSQQVLLPAFEKLKLACEYASFRDYRKILENRFDALLFYSGLPSKYKYPQVYLTTNAYGSGSGDGAVFNDAIATWAACKGAATGSSAGTTETTYRLYAINDSGASGWYLSRHFYPADTSGIGAGMVVSALDFVFNVSSLDSTGGVTAHLVQTSQAATNALATADYDNISFTSGGSVACTSTGAKTINGNSTSLSWVDVAGVSKIGLVTDYDQSNTSPGAGGYKAIIDQSEHATPASRPYFNITYSSSVETGGIINFI